VHLRDKRLEDVLLSTIHQAIIDEAMETDNSVKFDRAIHAAFRELQCIQQDIRNCDREVYQLREITRQELDKAQRDLSTWKVTGV